MKFAQPYECCITGDNLKSGIFYLSILASQIFFPQSEAHIFLFLIYFNARKLIVGNFIPCRFLTGAVIPRPPLLAPGQALRGANIDRSQTKPCVQKWPAHYHRS